jgi:hypothetical protein
MSSTRHAAPGTDPDAAPERNLSSPKLRGLQIGLNVITRVGRVRKPNERAAMIWLHNYARLQNLTADSLSDDLDLSKPEIRAALTDPEADLARFVRQVELVRHRFEVALPKIYPTAPAAIVQEGLTLALKRRKIVEIIGPTREGKTEPALDWFRRNAMDRGIYLNCPSDETDRTFYFEIARALGITFSPAKKSSQIIPQILGCLGTGMIELVVIDEGHFLWPSNPKAKPKRLEFLRSCYDAKNPAQIGLVVITTPQHTLSMNLALDPGKGNPRWAPGQWEGRAIPFHLPRNEYGPGGEVVKYAVSDADLEGVARHHAPDFTEGMIHGLVLHAKNTEGFFGAMVNAIELARFKAEARGLSKVTPNILIDAQKQMVAGTRIGQSAKNVTAMRRVA